MLWTRLGKTSTIGNIQGAGLKPALRNSFATLSLFRCRATGRSPLQDDSVHPAGGVVKQRGAFRGRIALRDFFKCVPNDDVRIGPLLDREITFEHAALDAAFFDAPFEIRPQFLSQFLGRRFYWPFMPIVA